MIEQGAEVGDVLSADEADGLFAENFDTPLRVSCSANTLVLIARRTSRSPSRSADGMKPGSAERRKAVIAISRKRWPWQPLKRKRLSTSKPGRVEKDTGRTETVWQARRAVEAGVKGR